MGQGCPALLWNCCGPITIYDNIPISVSLYRYSCLPLSPLSPIPHQRTPTLPPTRQPVQLLQRRKYPSPRVLNRLGADALRGDEGEAVRIVLVGEERVVGRWGGRGVAGVVHLLGGFMWVLLELVEDVRRPALCKNDIGPSPLVSDVHEGRGPGTARVALQGRHWEGRLGERLGGRKPFVNPAR